jgi:hypothetical protein
VRISVKEGHLFFEPFDECPDKKSGKKKPKKEEEVEAVDAT